LRKKIKHLNKCRKKNNAPNYVERFKVPTVLMIMFNMQCNILLIRATWFINDEILILLSFCVFIEMVNCLNTIILKSFLIIVFTSILHLFYRTIIPPIICTTHIFLSIDLSANAINVTISAKYKKLNYNKTRLKNVKN
jgi:hypothetical protein